MMILMTITMMMMAMAIMLGVHEEHLVEGGLQGSCSGLATAVHLNHFSIRIREITMIIFSDDGDLVSGDPPEVGHPGDGVGQLLDLLKVVGHGHSLPYLGVVRHGAEVT